MFYCSVPFTIWFPKVPYSCELDPYLMMYNLQRDYFGEFCGPL